MRHSKRAVPDQQHNRFFIWTIHLAGRNFSRHDNVWDTAFPTILRTQLDAEDYIPNNPTTYCISVPSRAHQCHSKKADTTNLAQPIGATSTKQSQPNATLAKNDKSLHPKHDAFNDAARYASSNGVGTTSLPLNVLNILWEQRSRTLLRSTNPHTRLWRTSFESNHDASK